MAGGRASAQLEGGAGPLEGVAGWVRPLLRRGQVSRSAAVGSVFWMSHFLRGVWTLLHYCLILKLEPAAASSSTRLVLPPPFVGGA